MTKAKTLPFGEGLAVIKGRVSPELTDALVSNDSDTAYRDDTPSLTRQEFAEECDINIIMAQYEKTGVINHFSPREPMYIDLTGVPDFRDAMDLFNEAEVAFMSLPAKVRKEFDNDPKKFVDFAVDPANLDQMRLWGLAPPAPAPLEPPKAAPEAPTDVKTPSPKAP